MDDAEWKDKKTFTARPRNVNCYMPTTPFYTNAVPLNVNYFHQPYIILYVQMGFHMSLLETILELLSFTSSIDLI